jgi:AbiTii-like protein
MGHVFQSVSTTVCEAKQMSLLREIQEAAASDEVPVATLLRKARILAARLESEPLQHWAQSELEGYRSGDTLPEYRQLRHLEVKADFSGPFGSGLRNANVPPACVDATDRASLFSADSYEGIAAVEDLLRSDAGSFSAPWPANAVVRYADSVYENMSMMHASKVIPRGAVIGIVDGVRNRLLSFALELEAVAPEAGDADTTTVPPNATVTQVFNNTIFGGQAVIAGHSVDHAALSMAVPNGWPDLRGTLENMGVPGTELEELLGAIQKDEGIGHETQNWIGRLASKVGLGAITLAGGVTTEVVAREITKALGG